MPEVPIEALIEVGPPTTCHRESAVANATRQFRLLLPCAPALPV